MQIKLLMINLILKNNLDYDLVLFSYSHTSTFNYFLKSNLPCIIFNTDTLLLGIKMI